MILESYTESNVYIDYEPITGVAVDVSFKPGEFIESSGTYISYRGVFMCLYVNESNVVFRYMDKVLVLRPDVVLEVYGDLNRRIIQVFVDGELQDELYYSVNADDILENDPTPFVDDEDFDFGLWVSNISKSEPRKRVLCDFYSSK